MQLMHQSRWIQRFLDGRNQADYITVDARFMSKRDGYPFKPSTMPQRGCRSSEWFPRLFRLDSIMNNVIIEESLILQKFIQWKIRNHHSNDLFESLQFHQDERTL